MSINHCLMCAVFCILKVFLFWSEWFWPDRNGGERLLVDVSQLVHDHSCCGEDPVGVQEGVQEVYGEEAQVSQPLQQPLHAGVADLGDLAGVERLAEANVNIIFMEAHIGSDGYTHKHTHIHTHKMTHGWMLGDKARKKLQKQQRITKKNKLSQVKQKKAR